MPTDKPSKARALFNLLKEMEEMSETADEVDTDEISRLGRENPLPIERVRPLYARVLKIIHPDHSDEDIASEVEEILARQGLERPES